MSDALPSSEFISGGLGLRRNVSVFIHPKEHEGERVDSFLEINIAAVIE